MIAAPLLEMNGIDKAFAGVQALRRVDLTLAMGEVLALMGENGAGKSTLMKVLSGAHRPDAGSIRLQGKDVELRTPQDAIHAGIAVIYQEFNLVPGLSARENIFLGQEPSRAGFVLRQQEARRVAAVFARLGVNLDPEIPCRQLTVAQQQTVEIARALVREARLIVMDEPTAALTGHEVERLFAIIRDLKAHGIGVIYISHRLEEIFAIADRIMVLRDGANVGAWPVGAVTRAELIERMVGRPLRDEFPKRAVQASDTITMLRGDANVDDVPAGAVMDSGLMERVGDRPAQVHRGEARLVVQGLSRGSAVRGVSFQIGRGEVLGLTGLVGAGRTETARAIFGADTKDAGEITLDGRRLTINCPRDAIRAGIGMLTEDRKTQGLVLAHAARDNFSLPNLDSLSRAGFVKQRQERDALAHYIGSLRIQLSGPDQPARYLSGGNQQKIVLAKWLARNCEVLLFDEPTRGIDVGAKYEIYTLINALADEGKAVLVISSELPEVLGMSDRILVMRAGRISGEITNVVSATQEQIMDLAMGNA